MLQAQALATRPDASGGYKVDPSRGARVGRVSFEWFSRPDDERFLSLSDLYASVKGRAERSRTRTVESAAIRVEAARDDAERLALRLPENDETIAPTRWSFGQLASRVGAPASYRLQLRYPTCRPVIQRSRSNGLAQMSCARPGRGRAQNAGWATHSGGCAPVSYSVRRLSTRPQTS